MKEQPKRESWSWATRIGFRFCFIYLGLFALATQVAGSLPPVISFRGFGPLWPMREITFWIALHVFGVGPTSNSIDPGQGGETIFYWIQASWLFVVAVLAAGVWSFFERRRTSHDTLHKWFRVFIRLGLAAQMLEYGMTKIIPNQFVVPTLNTLVTPVGDLPLNSLLWTSIGAATGYQIFTGCAELLAGILLLIPRTSLLGALLCLADLAQVLSLNMSYDIGLKLTTIHLVLLTMFLLLPDLRRLMNFFVLNRATDAAAEPPLFKTSAANRFAVAAQLLVGVYLLVTLTYVNVHHWYARGGGSPRSELYGIWDLDRLTIDGQTRVADLNDYDRRWRRAVFDAPNSMAFQRTDDSFARYDAAIIAANHRLSLTKPNSTTWKAAFTYQRPSPDHLILSGEMDGHQIDAQFRLVERDTLPLLNSNFRWMRPANPR